MSYRPRSPCFIRAIKPAATPNVKLRQISRSVNHRTYGDFRVIELQNVTQHYGIRPVLKDVTFEAESGELVAVLGPNGMGKSTLLSVMAGVLSPQRGSVRIDGVQRRSSVETEKAIRRKVVYLPDTVWLPSTRTGREFVLAVGRLYIHDDLQIMEHADRLFRLFQLTDQADSPISSYSTGQRKKISLCSAFITEAPIMLLDEPFSGGLDPSGILALKHLLKRLADRHDVTLVITTPVPEIVEDIADRIAIVHEGSIAAMGTLEELRTEARCDGPLGEVLEKLIHPETLDDIANYFAV